MFGFLKRLFKRPEDDRVPFYDFETGQVTLIPKAELSPGVVHIQIEGQAGPVYAEATQLRMGEYQQPAFEGEAREAILSLAADLAEVHPMSFEEWEDGFRRDRNPDREIAGWCHIAAIYKFVARRDALEFSQKKECFRVLVTCFTGPRETVVNRSDAMLLTSGQVAEIIQYFYEGGYE